MAFACREAGARPSEAAWTDRYPDDISPPAGTVYPCALTALPRELPGVPEGERRFVNHVYAEILAATRAKLVFLRDADEPAGAAPAFARYGAQLDAALAGVRAEAPPNGLGGFHADVVEALELQRATFGAAAAAPPGRVRAAVFERPESRLASQRLLRAWSAIGHRYRSAPSELRDSLYHHLCALDLF